MRSEEASQITESLFAAWAPTLFRYACRESGSRELAEDLVQEAFFVLYRDLRSGKAIENPKTWTLSIVRNQIRKHRRDTHRHGEDFEPGNVLDNFPAKAAPEGQRGDELTELLSLLSRREEEVLLLRLQSLKYREIAAHLGLSAKSVATLLARALKKMRVATNAQPDGKELLTVVGRNARKTLQ